MYQHHQFITQKSKTQLNCINYGNIYTKTYSKHKNAGLKKDSIQKRQQQ